MKKSLLMLVAAFFTVNAFAKDVVLTPEKIPCAVADRQEMQTPDRVHLSGMIGVRVENNAMNRLLPMDVDRLLEGYRKRPGRQTWDGEHVGKWLHAATLAWAYTGNAELRAKLDRVVRELVQCQLADGYLGTYEPKHYWTEWDVWAHKYNLIGLLTYVRYTGDRTPLPACCKMGDLLCKTFGDQPGQRDLMTAGGHMGMAPGSVLEPMTLLYRMTGERRYGDFCRYILRAYEHKNGPHIVSRLLEGKGVDKVGNAKAYEMLSCINGILEWHRTVGREDGQPDYLQAAINAWEDIVARRLYITGAASSFEVFHGDRELPNTGNVGETCVTVTWLQMNAHLLRLTGQARFAEQLERVVYNQLCGAQQPDGRAWGYYVQMEGTKPYSSRLDGHCCLSSGPRGFALVPTFAMTTDADGAVVNFYDACQADLKLRDGTAVKINVATNYPAADAIDVSVAPDKPQDFSVKLRIPAWCASPKLAVNGSPVEIFKGEDGYAVVHRRWTAGDKLELTLKLEPRVVVGDHNTAGKAAVLYGPLVLAADEALSDGHRLASLRLPSDDAAKLNVTPEPTPDALKTWPGDQVFRIDAVQRGTGQKITTRFTPFADAGENKKTSYKVWLPLANWKGDPKHTNVLEDGEESRSRPGNLEGSILDSRPVVTYDGHAAAEDWYAVALDQPATIGRIIFQHGKTFHDGGWFDASAGRPKVQIKRTAAGDWETIGELRDYPATTAGDSAKMQPNQRFTCKLAKPLSVVGVRVIGRPAHGDAPRQAFSSCGGLSALAE